MVVFMVRPESKKDHLLCPLNSEINLDFCEQQLRSGVQLPPLSLNSQ